MFALFNQQSLQLQRLFLSFNLDDCKKDRLIMTEENQNQELTEDEKKLFGDLLSEDGDDQSAFSEARRQFLKQITVAGGGMLAIQMLGGREVFANPANDPYSLSLENAVKVDFKVNGVKRSLSVDSRM